MKTREELIQRMEKELEGLEVRINKARDEALNCTKSQKLNMLRRIASLIELRETIEKHLSDLREESSDKIEEISSRLEQSWSFLRKAIEKIVSHESI